MRRRAFLLAVVPVFAGACAGDSTTADRAAPASSVTPSSLSPGTSPSVEMSSPTPSATTQPTSRESPVDATAYATTAQEWGERVTGVQNRLDTDESVIALTFDACGGPSGSAYDGALIEFLRAERVPATLFVNQRWAKANRSTLLSLADDPLFDIANHGTEHRPLSVNGAEVYGISGTTDPAGVVAEVGDNQRVLEELTGDLPAYFRSGTAYYDEVAVEIVNDMGLEVVGFDILGDAGATFDAPQVAAALSAAGPGSIALLHMNHPTSGTAEGVQVAVAELRSRGFDFVKLSEFPLTP